MNCKKTFNIDFISENCTSVFITKEYKKHREDILFDREKSLLPETQPYVIIEIQKKEIYKNIKQLNDQILELRIQERKINNTITGLYSQINHLSINSENTPEERKKFVRKCPIDNCRGFLSTQWKCGSCDKRICNKCNEENVEINGEPHQCNPEHVATMELLNKDTKPCPNCGTMIHRISGCSQIFCTDCHSAWDWNTCRIITGVIHNPHYYEFIRNGGNTSRNHGDIPCGGLPDIYALRSVLVGILGIDNPCYKYLYSIHQCINHIQHYEIRIIRENNPETRREQRIKYLMNEITEIEFKIILQQDEKKRQKMISFNNIYEMFVNVSSDILRQIIVFIQNNSNNFIENIKYITDNTVLLKKLVEYFNENLKKIGKTYKCVYPGIANNVTFVNNLETFNYKLKN